MTNKKYQISCFGASLTEGLSTDFNFYPYSTFLQQILQENNLAQFVRDPIANYGVSGEVTTQIQKRFNYMKEAKMILCKQDSDEEIFIFLAGTNDLGNNRSPEDTFGTLYEMVMDCINNGSRVIVCSIPSTALISDEDGSRNRWVLSRKKYNEKIENLAKELGEEVCLFYDCHKDTGVVMKDKQYGQEFTKLNPQLAADNLHLTKEGYKIVAEGVFEKLKKFLPSFASSTSAAKL